MVPFLENHRKLYFILYNMKSESESEVAQSCPTLSDPMDYSPPGPLSMGFSRQEYLSGGRHPEEARDAAASAAGTVSCGNHLCRNLVQLYVCRGLWHL